MARNPDLSVIIPVVDRVDDLGQLLAEYTRTLNELNLSFETIVVVDGGAAHLLDTIPVSHGENATIRIFQLAKYFGEATSIQAGFDNAKGDLILTLPAYYQVEPNAIKSLFDEITNCDMVVCHRSPRRGTTFEVFRRRSFHSIIRVLSGQRFRDLGCGVRLMKRQVAVEVALYGDLHRFLPILASRQGFVVREIDVGQSAFDEHRGTYRLREYIHRLLDIVTVFFLVRFTKKPLRFFGMLGSVAVGIGGAVVLLTVVQRIFFDMALADRPALLLGSLLLVLGVQSVALGLIGELIIFTHAGALKEYKIARILNSDSAQD